MCSFKWCVLLVFTIFLSILLIPPSLYPQVFTYGSSYPTGNHPECVVAADFDGDSDIDIAVGHRKDTLIIIYSNDGDANFTPVDSLSAFFMRVLFVADLNGDRISDLMACQEYGNTVRFWYSNGDGTFDLGFEEQFGHWPEQLCAADFNGDMIMDVAYNNIFDGSGISIKFGKGNGLFDPSVVIVPGVKGSNIGTGDFDNDGDMDIVFDGVYSILNNGDGTFGDTLKALGSLNAFMVTEINGDEYPDLVGIGTYGCAGSPVYMLGTESGIFSERQIAWIVAGWLATNSPLCADFNNDGSTDIAISARDGLGTMRCCFNDGLTRFRTSEFIPYPDTGSLCMAAGDFNGDGDIDIAVTSYDDSLIIIHSSAAAHVRRMQIPVDFLTIGEAVDYAWNLDTIIVEPGIYHEHIDFGGKNIVLMSSEYANGGIFKELSSFNILSSSTIIDGGDTNRVITFDDGEDHRSVIAGFTIQNGNAAGYGGGIFCYDTAAPTIKYNIFRNNFAGSAGGAICVGKGTVGVKNNLFVGNSSGLWGGGIFIAGPCNIINNTFYGNRAVNGGGGLYLNYGNPKITSNIFWDNSSVSNGQEIHYLNSPPTITYSIIRGGWPGEGNIDLYPMFADTANGDFNLMSGSPCVNAGDPNLPLDPDGTTADIGAYFYFNPVSVEEDPNKYQIPSLFYLTQNYPNPFNPITTIKYQLPVESHAILKVYNRLGQEVKTLISEKQDPGYHEITWNAAEVASGVYFYRFEAVSTINPSNVFVNTLKMILIK